MTAPVHGEFDARVVVENLLIDAVRRRASDVRVELTACSTSHPRSTRRRGGAW